MSEAGATPERGCAVVLGATSPIAEAICHGAARRGYTVLAAARREEEAAAVASDVAIREGVATVSATFDALDTGSHEALFERAERELGPVELVFVVFGEMGDQEVSERDFSMAERVIGVNYTGAASASEAAARALVRTASARSKGEAGSRPTLVGISSVAGDRGRGSNYVYGSAKGAYSLYLQGLRNRLAKRDVHVLTVKYGFIDTRMTADLETKIPVASPEDAAEAALRAAEKGRNVLYFPWFWRWIMTVIRCIPESVFKRLSL